MSGMSWSDVLRDPNWFVAKILFIGIGAWYIFSTILAYCQLMIHLVTTGNDNMIFESIEEWVLLLGLVAGVFAIAFIGYWFEWQDYMAKNNVAVKFSIRYVVAGGLTIASSVFVGYMVIQYGLVLVCENWIITDPMFAGCITFAVGGALSFIVDAALFHPIADGTAANAWNKAQEAVREQLASDEAKATFKSLVQGVCADFGVESKVDDIFTFADKYIKDSTSLTEIKDLVKDYVGSHVTATTSTTTEAVNQ